MRTTSILLLTIYTLAATLSYGKEETPSITYLLQQSKNDKERLQAYNKLFKQLEFSNNDSLIYYLQIGLKEFKERKFIKGEAALLSMLGSAYSIKGMLPAAKNHANGALYLFKKLEDKDGMATANNSLGIIEGKTGNYKNALEHFYAALRLFEETDNKEGVGRTYVKLGVAYELSDNLEQGLSYYQKALAFQEGKPPSGDIITLYNNIGSLYCRKKAFKTAIPYFEKALQLTSTEQFKQMRCYPLLNLGKVYMELGDKEKGRNYLLAALENTQQERLPDQEAKVLLNMAEIAPDKEQAALYLDKALNIAKSIGEKRLQVEVLEAMAQFYKSIKDFEKALAVHEAYKAIDDSIFDLEKQKEIANLQSVYELEKSNIKIDELKAANRKNTYFRNIIIGIAIVLASLLVLSFFFLLRIRKLNKKILISEKALKKANEDKDRLFSVIGHDLRNHVSNVPIVLEMYEDENLTKEERGFLLESLKENTLATKDTLEKLLNWGKSQIRGITATPSGFYVRDKILNKLRLMKSACEQKQITLKNNIEEDIMIYADEEHFKFVMRNLLSNAIKYTRHGGCIEINAERRSGEVIFSIKDNGIGMTKAQQEHIFEPFITSLEGTDREKGNGIGLMLCKEFIVKNGGRIWAKSEKDKGSTFYFSLKEAIVGDLLV